MVLLILLWWHNILRYWKSRNHLKKGLTLINLFVVLLKNSMITPWYISNLLNLNQGQLSKNCFFKLNTFRIRRLYLFSWRIVIKTQAFVRFLWDQNNSRQVGKTAQKMKFSIKETADLVIFTGKIFNGKLHFLCCVTLWSFGKKWQHQISLFLACFSRRLRITCICLHYKIPLITK